MAKSPEEITRIKELAAAKILQFYKDLPERSSDPLEGLPKVFGKYYNECNGVGSAIAEIAMSALNQATSQEQADKIYQAFTSSAAMKAAEEFLNSNKSSLWTRAFSGIGEVEAKKRFPVSPQGQAIVRISEAKIAEIVHDRVAPAVVAAAPAAASTVAAEAVHTPPSPAVTARAEEPSIAVGGVRLDMSSAAGTLGTLLGGLSGNIDHVLDSTASSKKGWITARLLDALSNFGRAEMVGAALTDPTAVARAVGDYTQALRGTWWGDLLNQAIDYAAPDRPKESQINALISGLASPDRYKVIFGLLSDWQCIGALETHKTVLTKIVGKILGANSEELGSEVAPMVESLLQVLKKLPPAPQAVTFMDFLKKIHVKLSEEKSDPEFAKELENFVTKAMNLGAKKGEGGFLPDLIISITFMPGTEKYKETLQPVLGKALLALGIRQAAQPDQRIDFAKFMLAFRQEQSAGFLDGYADQMMQWSLFKTLDFGLNQNSGVGRVVGVEPPMLNLGNCIFAGVNMQQCRFTDPGGVSFKGSDLTKVNMFLVEFKGPVDFTDAIIDDKTLQTLLPSIREAMYKGITVNLSTWEERPEIKALLAEVAAFNAIDAKSNTLARESMLFECEVKRKLLDVAELIAWSPGGNKDRVASVEQLYKHMVGKSVSQQRALCYMLANSREQVEALKALEPDSIRNVFASLEKHEDFARLAAEFKKDPSYTGVKSGSVDDASLDGVVGLLGLVNTPTMVEFFEYTPGQKATSFGEFLRSTLENKVSPIFAKESRIGQFIASRSLGQVLELAMFAISNIFTIKRLYKEAQPALGADPIKIFDGLLKNSAVAGLLAGDLCANLLLATQEFVPNKAEAQRLVGGVDTVCKLVDKHNLSDKIGDIVQAKNSVARWNAISQFVGHAGQKNLVVLLADLHPLYANLTQQYGKLFSKPKPAGKQHYQDAARAAVAKTGITSHAAAVVAVTQGAAGKVLHTATKQGEALQNAGVPIPEGMLKGRERSAD